LRRSHRAPRTVAAALIVAALVAGTYFAGQVAFPVIAAAAACFLGAAVWSIRARLRSIEERHFKAGDIVFRQGDYPDRLYVVGSGEVEVIREVPGEEAMVLTRLGKDEFFGEIGILSDTPRTATVRAVTDVDVLSIHRSYFTSLFSYLPMFRDRILAAYLARTGGSR